MNCEKCNADLSGVKERSGTSKTGKPWRALFCTSCKAANWLPTDRAVSKVTETFAGKVVKESDTTLSEILAVLTQIEKNTRSDKVEWDG